MQAEILLNFGVEIDYILLREQFDDIKFSGILHVLYHELLLVFFLGIFYLLVYVKETIYCHVKIF